MFFRFLNGWTSIWNAKAKPQRIFFLNNFVHFLRQKRKFPFQISDLLTWGVHIWNIQIWNILRGCSIWNNSLYLPLTCTNPPTHTRTHVWTHALVQKHAYCTPTHTHNHPCMCTLTQTVTLLKYFDICIVWKRDLSKKNFNTCFEVWKLSKTNSFCF